MSEAPVSPSWRILLTPRWLGWHLFAVVAVVGMCWLGKWQFDRAMAGNTLSWAYTFEWPIFAIFGIVFWVKTIKDELHPAPEKPPSQVELPDGASVVDVRADVAGAMTADALAGEAGHEMAEGAPAAHTAARETDMELAEYNAYLAKLSGEVKGHGRWHGLR
ncbi:MAG: hypothetical protein LBV34_16635 [Nocardiopsaceae bacterium]|jgi:hypothetical protein|nr:hypothetical protein [Nocardiopsaceae bacterium]